MTASRPRGVYSSLHASRIAFPSKIMTAAAPLYPPRIMAGIQPASRFHLGHYCGALKHHIRMHREYPGDCFIMIADYHALTRRPVTPELCDYTLEAATVYLAFGLDPEIAVLYRQSDVPQITELAWILSCFASPEELSHGLASLGEKPAASPNNLGFLYYPVLMAADVLALRATMISVDKNQLRDVDCIQKIADRVNQQVQEDFFPIPEPILANMGVIPGIDGKRMMRDSANIIPLFLRYGQLKELVAQIKVGPEAAGAAKHPGSCTVFALLEQVCPAAYLADIRARYLLSGREAISYDEAKEILTKQIQEHFAPYEERYYKLKGDPDFVWDVLKAGVARVADEVEYTVDRVRHHCGVVR